MSHATPTEDSLSTNQDPDVPVHGAPETEIVLTRKVSCSGNEALGLGHPRVWMAISDDVGWVECGYCDKRFVLDLANALDDH